MRIDDIFDGIDPPENTPTVHYNNVRGREEHEALLLDVDKCRELGLDRIYEIIAYLHRWGGWLNDPYL